MTPLLARCLLGAAAACWSGGALVGLIAWRRPAQRPALLRLAHRLGWVGVATCAILLGGLWISLGRPPLRSLGETRLWYAVLLATLGLLAAWRLRAALLAPAAQAFALVFIALDLLRPEAFDRTLPPALQSVWFVPHVVVYMLGYAALGLAGLVAALGLCGRAVAGDDDARLTSVLGRLGLVCLTLGLAAGTAWAKVAWGDHWAWDPKETWALISWLAAVAALHAEGRCPARGRRLAWLLVFAGVLGCWLLVNALPAGRASVHAYG